MAVLWDGQSGCGVSDQALFLKPTVKTVQVFSQLLIGLSAGGRGLVAGDGFQAFPHLCRVVA